MAHTLRFEISARDPGVQKRRQEPIPEAMLNEFEAEVQRHTRGIKEAAAYAQKMP